MLAFTPSICRALNVWPRTTPTSFVREESSRKRLRLRPLRPAKSGTRVLPAPPVALTRCAREVRRETDRGLRLESWQTERVWFEQSGVVGRSDLEGRTHARASRGAAHH